MKSVQDMTPQQLREAAFEAILNDLGPIGLARFVRENGLGAGDYTRDRSEWLTGGESINDVVEEWRQQRASEK